MEFIDFHTHIYPDDIAQKATDSVRKFYSLGEAGMNGTAKMLLEQGGKVGTTRYVLLPVAILPERVRHINDFILGQVAAESRFFGFGAVHGAMENLMGEVEYIEKNGLKGIKLHPDSQGFPIDDERMLPVYEQIQGKLPVLIHMGDHRFDYSHPARLRRVLGMFPKLQVIAAHFGGHEMYEEAYHQLKDTNCFLDVSSAIMFMEEGMPESYVNRYGAERFVYGSDYPMWNPVTEMERFLRLKLTDAQFEQIAHKTAEVILELC